MAPGSAWREPALISFPSWSLGTRTKQPTKTRSDYQVWQEGFHPQQIVSQEMLHQKVDYLHHNPVRIGVVQRPEDWVYSSARDYAGGKGLIELDVLV